MALQSVCSHYLFSFCNASIIFPSIGYNVFPLPGDSFSPQLCSSEQVSWQGQRGMGSLPSLLCPGALLPDTKCVGDRIHVCSVPALSPCQRLSLWREGEVADIDQHLPGLKHFPSSLYVIILFNLPRKTARGRYFSPHFIDGETEAQISCIPCSKPGLGPSFLWL